jgi:hypothetical protein
VDVGAIHDFVSMCVSNKKVTSACASVRRKFPGVKVVNFVNHLDSHEN